MRLLLASTLLAAVVATAGCADEDRGAIAEPDPTPTTSAGAPSAELASVTEDANRVTPALESYYFGTGEYARTVGDAVADLASAGQELSEGNTVGGYAYDEADEDFTLCVEGPSGAHATYDTSPMSLFETGESGGCPD